MRLEAKERMNRLSLEIKAGVKPFRTLVAASESLADKVYVS